MFNSCRDQQQRIKPAKGKFGEVNGPASLECQIKIHKKVLILFSCRLLKTQ